MNQPAEQIHQVNQELITHVLQQLLQEKPQLLSNATCQCHRIDPNKMRILLWKNSEPNKPDTYILKIAEQKFVGTQRSDRRGEVYWKFRELYESEKEQPAAQPAPESKPTPKVSYKPEPHWTPYASEAQSLSGHKSTVDKVAKFQERQAKAQGLQANTASENTQATSQTASPEINYARNSTNSEATAATNRA